MPATFILARIALSAALLIALASPSRASDIGDGSYTGSGSDTGSGSNTGSGADTGSGAGTTEYSAGSTDLAGGFVSLATVILNGGTVTNGTLNASTNIDARSGSVSAQLVGTGTLIKTTTGTVELAGTNTYTGPTTVQAGLLRVTGSLGATPVTVQTGGTLGGTGTIGGPTTLQAGGTLAPGASPGTITFTNGLALEAGSILEFELGTPSDRIVVSGGVLSGPASGTVGLSLIGSIESIGGTYALLSFAGATPANFEAGDFTISSAPSGWLYDLSIDGDELLLAVTAVPEPATAALVLGGAVTLLVFGRRRRRA